MLKHSRSLHEISNNPQNSAINDYSKYHYHQKIKKLQKRLHHNKTNHFANTSYNISPLKDQFMQFPNQMHNFQNSLWEKIVTLSPQNNQPFVFTPQTNMFVNLNIQATNVNNAFLTPLNRLDPSSTVDSNIPNINGHKKNIQNNRDSTIQNQDQPSNDDITKWLVLDDSSSISFASTVESIDSLTDVNVFNCLPEQLPCYNYSRRQCRTLIENYSTCYKIKFHQICPTMMKKCCKIKLLQISNCLDFVSLWDQCHGHLTTEDNNKAQEKSLTWPAFIWLVLTDKNIINEYGTGIWQFIPKTWRYWWVDAYSTLYFNSNVRLHEPPPFFEDKTRDIIHWDELINSYTLIFFILKTIAYSKKIHIWITNEKLIDA